MSSKSSTPRTYSASSATQSPNYGVMSGSPVSSLKRGKGTLSRQESIAADASGDRYSARIMQDEDDDSTVISRKMFDELRSDTLDETISEAGSDEEEAIALDDEDQDGSRQRATPGSSSGSPSSVRPASGRRERNDKASATPRQPDQPVGQLDKLTLLRDDTPIRKLRSKEKEAQKEVDAWRRLHLRQEILGIAKLYSATGPYKKDNNFPMLVPEAHFQLAKAYADLQCITQATDHCKRALEVMPSIGEVHPKIVAFEQDVYIMQAEMLLMASPPKPQAALQNILSAANVDQPELIESLGIRVLAVQCYSMMGMAKLQEAYATRTAVEALQQRVESLSAKLQELNRKTTEYEKLLHRVRDTKSELKEEENFEIILIREAKELLEKASEILIEVIGEEEARIKKKIPDPQWKTHPLIVALWRQGCEIMFKLALAEGCAGNVAGQVISLQEVLSAHAVHHCVPDSLLARTYKERGAALTAMAAGLPDEESRDAKLKDALEMYDKLLKLQATRYPNDSEKQAMLRAETLKLIGNVYVARKQYGRAKQNYRTAIDIFASYLGGDSALVQDLEHRISQVQSYVDV